MLNAGSMVVPDSLIRAFHAHGVPVGQIYGCTETAPIATVLRKEDAARKLGSAGKPAPHCEVKLVEGEIWVRGPNVMRCYWNDPVGTAAAMTPEGWFKTGDLARTDEEGYYWIMGRSKDVIISGGENISSLEVEDVLCRHPAVLMAAVVARPDPKWGETPCAFIELKTGANPTAQEIIEFCRTNMARFKVPKAVIFGVLPKTSTGKIQKFVLREQAKSASAIE